MRVKKKQVHAPGRYKIHDEREIDNPGRTPDSSRDPGSERAGSGAEAWTDTAPLMKPTNHCHDI